MLVEAEAAQEAIDEARAEPRGVIRMTCPVALLHVHVGGMLADFMVQYPLVASPRLIEQYGFPASSPDLSALPSLDRGGPGNRSPGRFSGRTGRRPSSITHPVS